MKIIWLIKILFFLSVICAAQIPQVIVFKHELRWADESRFPNYFLLQEVRDSTFYNTKLQLMNYLKVSDINFPKDIDYKIIPGFGKLKAEMPESISASDPVIGIFSFITRATFGYAMFWKLKIIISQNNKIILDNEVNHELEYFSPSGYIESRLWISSEEFQDIFNQLIKETLGLLPASGEKIVLGSLESIEEKVRSFSPQLKRTILKMKGAWKEGGNFSAVLESEKDTIFEFNFRNGFLWEIPVPSLSGLIASLFTEITGVDFLYDQKVKKQLNGTLFFSDDKKFIIKLKWIEIEKRSVKSGDVITSISNPMIAELYDQKEQTGYFVYSLREKVNVSNKTTEKFNAFTGFQKENTLGIERIHRIEGSISGKTILAELNESHGIIMIKSGNDIPGVMVVYNCNPENLLYANKKLTKNKRSIVSSSQTIVKPSMDNVQKVEWYPLYLPENFTDDFRKICIKTLVCLFFGIGNM